MHGARRHRWCAVLQLGEHCAVGTGHLLRKGGLEDREGLAELHRATLELTEHLEELLGRTRLQLGGNQLGGLATDPLAEAEGGAPGQAEGHAGETRAAHDCLAR